MSSPPSESVQVGVGAPGLNVAVTVLLPLTVIFSGLVLPLRSPDQVLKAQLASGTTVS